MVKRRPSAHFRRVRTKRGKKLVFINPDMKPLCMLANKISEGGRWVYIRKDFFFNLINELNKEAPGEARIEVDESYYLESLDRIPERRLVFYAEDGSIYRSMPIYFHKGYILARPDIYERLVEFEEMVYRGYSGQTLFMRVLGSCLAGK